MGPVSLRGLRELGGPRDPLPNPAVLRGEAAGLPRGSSLGPWFPVPRLAGKR